MDSSSWLVQRSTKLMEQLRQEALKAGVINATQTICCDLKVVSTAATQEKVETLKAKFGYKDVTIYPEGLSVATIEVDSGRAGKSEWSFHILSDGTRAYPQKYKYAGPFVRGFAVVAFHFGLGPLRFIHIRPDGKSAYDTDHFFTMAYPFSEEGVAKVVWNHREGQRSCFVDLSGKLIEKS
jgi:hypothetical protein